MQNLKTTLGNSTFKKPNFTAEQWADMAAQAKAWDEIQAAQEQLQQLSRARIPADYIGAKMNSDVEEWINKPGKGLFINGGVGRGKTYQACAALQNWVKQDGTALFASFDDLLRECRATFNNANTELSVINRYANVGLLCIDDMGKERATEWSLPIIFSVLNKRSMNSKPTIITTQYTGRQLVERLTVNSDSETARAIVSRFFEYKKMTLEGKDWRRDG